VRISSFTPGTQASPEPRRPHHPPPRPGHQVRPKDQFDPAPVGAPEPIAPSNLPEPWVGWVTDGARRFRDYGYQGTQARMDQLAVGPDGESRLLKALLGGDPAIAARLAMIDDEAGVAGAVSQTLELEHRALKQLRESFGPLRERLGEVEGQLQAGGVGDTLERTYLTEKVALEGLMNGLAPLDQAIEERRNLLMTALFPAGAVIQPDLEASTLEAVRGGGKAIEARIAQIDHTFMVARLTPDGLERLQIEQKVLASISRLLSS
jgi:hypothetical protein